MNLIDTSVVLKWFVREEGSDRAAELIGTMLMAPDLMLVELANALWKKLARREIEPRQADLALSEAEASIALMPTSPLARRALAIARQLEHAVYDCFYLALAEETGARLITADARLIQRCTGTAFQPLVCSLEGLGA